MANDATLWDILLGIFGIDSETVENDLGVEAVPNG